MGRPGSDLTHVVLTGFMASGKTAIGRSLARRLGWDFLDLDGLIETTQGRSVAEIFAAEGESEFRRIEHEAVERLAPEVPTVISTGGGTYAFEENRNALRRLGVVVCLVTNMDTILERVRRNTNRPLAQGEDLEERLTALYASRLPSYRKADILIETDGLTVAGATARVLAMLAPRLREAQTSIERGGGVEDGDAEE